MLMARNNPKDFNYIVAYMAGTEIHGITEGFYPCKTLEDVVDAMDDVKKVHGFWKLSVCQIIEEYES